MRVLQPAGLVLSAAILLPTLLSSPAEAELTISSGPTANVTCSGGVCTAVHKKANLNVGDLQALLATGNVTVEAPYYPSVDDMVVSAEIDWTSSHSLTLFAFRSIYLNKTIAMNGPGGLTITTNDGTPSYVGALVYGARGNIISLGTANALAINGTTYSLANTIAELAEMIAANPGGNYGFSGYYNAHGDGQYAHAPVPTVFTGTLDGLGNTISSVAVVDKTDGYAGFFAQLGASATVRNLTLRNMRVVGSGQNPLFEGSLAGLNYGVIDNCFAHGLMKASGANGIYAGGLVGQNNGFVENSGADVAVSAAANSVSGGLVGLSIEGQILDSFATGAVSASGGQSFLGGLAGESYKSNISNNYATGAAAGSADSSVGGLVGLLQDSTVISSYSTGPVSGGTSHNAYGFAGGLVGFDDGSNTYSGSYWDLTTSGFSQPSQGTGNYPNFPGITGVTTVQLRSGLPTGLAPSIWAESAKYNNGFPYLLAAPRQ